MTQSEHRLKGKKRRQFRIDIGKKSKKRNVSAFLPSSVDFSPCFSLLCQSLCLHQPTSNICAISSLLLFPTCVSITVPSPAYFSSCSSFLCQSLCLHQSTSLLASLSYINPNFFLILPFSLSSPAIKENNFNFLMRNEYKTSFCLRKKNSRPPDRGLEPLTLRLKV